GGDGVDRRHAAGKNTRCRPAFERRQVGLQPVAGWIRYTSVFVALVLANLFLSISGSWVDGNAYRAGKRVGLLSDVYGAGCETRRFKGHRFLPRLYTPPSKIFFDKYRSAESGISVTTRFPAPSRFAICTAAYTLAPALEPPST